MEINVPKDLTSYRRFFPITEHCAFLDHAAVAPLSTKVRDVQQRLIDARVSGTDVDEELEAGPKHVREMCARLVGGEPEEIALTRNTSHGLNIVASGIHWHSGDNIVTAEMEFPANVYPWTNLCRREAWKSVSLPHETIVFW